MKKIKEKERRIDGIEFVTEILRAISSYDKKAQIINRLNNQLPDISEQITKRMFIFTDIAYLDDRIVQRIIKEVDFPLLAKALKNSDIIIQDKIFKNLSKRIANQLRDELDFMGKILLTEVEESQNHILKTIMHLKEIGEINISYDSREYV
jgi:flagellar motor switch protein FliG